MKDKWEREILELTFAFKCAARRRSFHPSVYKVEVGLDGFERIANNENAFAFEFIERDA